MKKMVRCKACGYIMEESKLGDFCPACGVPRISFEPYTDSISESRRRILNFDLHPIAVHFPVSFTVAVLVFSVASLLFSGQIEDLLTCTTKMLALFCPLSYCWLFWWACWTGRPVSVKSGIRTY